MNTTTAKTIYQNKDSKRKQILIHVLGCILFLAVPFLIGPEGINSLKDIARNPDLRREFLSYVLLLLFFYLNYDLLIAKIFFAKKYFLYAGIITILFFLIVLIPQLIIPLPVFGHPEIPWIAENHRPPFPPDKRLLFHLSHNLYLFLAVSFFSIILKINNRLKQTEKQKISSELLYLRAQINPHFLFNTLNSIYSLALEKSDYTPTAVVKLSGMMRYVISETENDFVSLEKEIEYISDYIELQKIRFDNATKVTFEVRGEPLRKKIAPLILIPFIENAIKYGVCPEVNSNIFIKVEIIANELSLKVQNNKVNAPIDIAGKSRVGIENAKTRLKLLYPGKHSLIMKENESEFKIQLTLYLA